MKLSRVMSRLLLATALSTPLAFAPAALAQAPAAEDIPVIAPAATSFVLDNGLTVVVVPDRRAPVVTHMVYYKVGSADEQPGQTGIAHFLEHLMFKGTTTVPDGVFSDTIAELGGDENAFTTPDYTGYYQTIAKEYIGTAMELEADRMANLQFPDSTVLPERDVILEERNTRVENEPGALLSEAVMATFFRNSTYRNPVIGWRHEMEKLDGAMAIDFYNKYYTPNNAIVVLAGDISEGEARTLAADTYGKLARRFDPPPRNRPTEPPSVASRTVTLVDERVSQPSVSISYLTPSYTAGDGREGLALDLLSDIMGGGSTSRIYRAMVLGGDATSAWSSYSGSWIGEGRYVVAGVPKDGVTIEKISDDLLAIIEDVKANGVTAEELASAKRRVLAGAIFSQDNQSNMARLFGGALAIGQTMEQVQNLPARIQDITLEEVNAATRYLDLKGSVTARLEPAPATPAP